MKLLSLFFLTIFLGKGCTPEQQKDIADTILEYSSVTRGSRISIIIQNKSVTVSGNNRGTKSEYTEAISDANWKQLITEFQKVNIDNLPNLKAPTQKRLYDGAGTANLKITYKSKTSETTGFDNTDPPAEIAGLIGIIIGVTKGQE